MGKKKHFIDKNNSQHFYLLNRSQTDEAYAREGNPSNFVLVPSINNKKSRGPTSSGENLNSLLGSKDHINPLGFKNDGYDYTQHLKEIGGGIFIGKNGSQVLSSSLQGKIVDEKDFSLPEDLFSSGVELQRDLEAITISHELMDDDIRAALFDEVDENGEKFEELQDDFITHAMVGGGEEDFDFDAHIAQLIARSENMIGKSPFKGGRSKVEVNDEDEFEEYFDDEDEEDGYEDDTSSGVVAPISQGNRELIEKQFEKTFLEYEDSAIGYLSEAESEADGIIDLDGDDPLLEAALEDFIRGQEETAGLERVVAIPANEQGGEEDEDDNHQPVDFHVEYKQQQALQIDATDALQTIVSSAEDTTLEICQEYLREVKIESEWDCETIISTYSILENHPTIIQDERCAGGSRRPRGGARSSLSQSSGVESVASLGGRSKSLGSGHPAPVILKATAGETASAKPANGRAAVKFNASMTVTAATASNGKTLEKVDEKGEESSEDDESDSGDSRDEDNRSNSKPKGFKNETSEEKRIRKSKVKEEKRLRRLQKKANKQSFRLEECRSSSLMQKSSSGSIYKY